MKGEVYMNFGEVLKELRAERGITQEKLARDLDIPESSIRRLETSDGVPRKERIHQIATYFGVSTDRLLGIKAKEEPQLSPNDKEIIKGLKKIPEFQKTAVKNLIDSMIKAQEVD